MDHEKSKVLKPGGRLKKTLTEVVEKDCQIQQERRYKL